MAVHKPTDRLFPTIGGSVLKEGRSLNLTKGTFGIFDVQNTSKEGSKALSSFKGINPNTKLEMKLGVSDLPITRTSGNKSWSTFPFTLKDVVSVNVSKPTRTTQKVDELIVGYNGIDPKTSFNFELGQIEEFVLRITGEPLGLYGIRGNMIDIPFYMSSEGCKIGGNPCEECNPCTGVDCGAITLNAIEYLKSFPVVGDRRLTDFMEITPVLKCKESESYNEKDYKFYCLEKCDQGNDIALAEVQAQVGKFAVVTGRHGSVTTYQIAQPADAGAPKPFKAKLSDLLKGCDKCPDGYTEVEGGLVYAVTLEDDGENKSDIVETLANAVSDTGVKSDGQKAGLGTYTVILSEKLKDSDLVKFIEDNPTATVAFVGKSADWCEAGEGEEIEWTECGSCKMSERPFTITLPDTECGESRLPELQAFYPELTIEEVKDSEAACQRKYKTTTPTNVVCDECDDVFKDVYSAQAPGEFEGTKWSGEEVGMVNDCLCGIRFKAKTFEIQADGCLEDKFGFMDSSVKIEVSGGFDREHLYGINDFDPIDVAVTWLSRWEPRTHMGANLKSWEKESQVYFTGESFGADYMEKVLTGKESHLESGKQYVLYAVTLNRPIMSQGFAGYTIDTVTYHIASEIGKHKDVEDVINALAAGAGVEPVKA